MSSISSGLITSLMSISSGMVPLTSRVFTTTPSGAFTGTLTVNTEPLPNTVLRRRLPPSTETICLTSARPTPEPMLFLLVDDW